MGTDTIFGGVNAVRGSNFDDVLTGSASNDTLEGLSGNDLLRGGLGADFLNGGAGSDTYDFNMLEEAADTVSGFEAVPGGDVLDIADLLAFSTSYAGGAGGPLANFVRLEAAGSDAQLQIDTNGSAGGAILADARHPARGRGRSRSTRWSPTATSTSGPAAAASR